MLVFDLRSLAVAAAPVKDVLAPTDPVWQADDSPPINGVSVEGRLSAAGPGRFYFSGRIMGAFRAECRRCLTEVETVVNERVQLLFAEPGETESEDPDVAVFDPRAHELDMRPAIREQWLLNVPVFVQCREDCAGLCPTCGTDLNAGPCHCEEPIDARWAALRSAGTPGRTGGAAS
jgi:uncharacterized protein